MGRLSYSIAVIPPQEHAQRNLLLNHLYGVSSPQALYQPMLTRIFYPTQEEIEVRLLCRVSSRVVSSRTSFSRHAGRKNWQRSTMDEVVLRRHFLKFSRLLVRTQSHILIFCIESMHYPSKLNFYVFGTDFYSLIPSGNTRNARAFTRREFCSTQRLQALVEFYTKCIRTEIHTS
jgi:hypothetical protein